MAKAEAWYRGVRGSAGLVTRPVAPASVPAEALEAGEMRRVPFAGELLGAARVRARFAAIPLDAFDRAGEVLEAEAQATWLHLLRLSYGEGRNWCRAGKKELMARLRLSERRLLAVLDRLVEKGFARPLHRDNRGTLWKVSLPAEAFGEPVGDDVLLGRAAPVAVSSAPPDEVRPPRAVPPVPSVPRARSAERAPEGLAALARDLALARGDTSPDGLARALREVRELVGEGQSLARITAGIATLRRRAARNTGGSP